MADDEQRQAIKEHYNLHVNEHVSTAQALRARREGPAAPLKQFHNEIKRRLIYRFAYQAEALLDYACGRGGDLQKWRAAQVRFVKGLDLSPREVAEAQRRYGELLAKEPGVLQAVFQQTDALGLSVVAEDRQYDAVTCMFALHYFFNKEDTLKTLLATVAANLKPGGYFIGCVPDGKRVKAHLQSAAGHLVKPHLVLKWVNADVKAAFGGSYVMEIPDTVVEGHSGVSEGSTEYLVFDKVLLGVARAAGLHPVTDYADPAMDALFEPGDADKPVKHFNPSYPPGTDASLALASRLYMAFVFQKAADPSQAVAPPLPPPEPRGRPPGPQQQRGRRLSRSPPRSERFAPSQQAQQQQAQQQQAQQQQAQQDGTEQNGQQPWQQAQQRPGAPGWRGGGGRSKMSSLDWQLPYPGRSLEPDLPSAYVNVKHSSKTGATGLVGREAAGRFVVKPPPLPFYPGPVQYDEHGAASVRTLPDGRPVNSYYDELNYNAALQLRESQAQQALAAQQQQLGAQHQQQQPLQQQPQHVSQQPQQPGAPQQQPPGGAGQLPARGPLGVGQRPAAATQAAAAPAPPPQQQQQQQQPPPSPPADAQQPTGGGTGAAGRGSGGGRGKRGSASGDAAGSQEAAGSGGRGRGRGRGGAKAAGAKRGRADGADAADAEAGGAAAASEAGAAQPPPPPSKKLAAAPSGAAAAAAAKPAGKAAARGDDDPLGYRGHAPKALPPDLLQSLDAVCLGYEKS